MIKDNQPDQPDQPDQHITIWTDGSCLGNPGLGGWAFIIEYNNYEYEVSCCSNGITTNNEMELTAIIKSIQFLYDENIINDENITNIIIMSDSNYAIRGINEWIENWINTHKSKSNQNKRPNWKLWTQLYKLKLQISLSKIIRFKWVKAHSTNEMNNRVDKLARQRAEENNL